MSSTQTEAALPFDAAAAMAPRRRIGRRVVVAIVLLGVASGGMYLARGQWRAGGPGEDIRLFEVTRRGVPVLIEEKGELKATNSVDVQNEVEGRATIIYLISEGTQAKKGDVLVELASDEIDERIEELKIRVATSEAAHEKAKTDLDILRDKSKSDSRKAELAVRLAELALQRYQKGESVELLKDAELTRDQAQRELERARDYLKDSDELFKQGFITQIEHQDDVFAEYRRKNELTKAELTLEVLQTYTIKMDQEKKSSDLAEAKAELDRTNKAAEASEAQAVADVKAKSDQLEIERGKLEKATKQKEKARILAPADGLVVYKKENSWDDDSRIKTGAQVHERQVLIELPDTSSMKVVIRVHEAQIDRLKEGQSATVAIEGSVERQFTGTVSKIGVLADAEHRWLNPNLKQFETEVQLDGQVTDLKPGATAHVQVQIAQLDNVIAVPVQAVFGKGGKYYIFLDESGDARPIEVRIGASSNEYIEITEGLEVGRKVRLAVTDEMRLRLPEEEPANGEGAKRPAKGRPGVIDGAGQGKERQGTTDATGKPKERPGPVGGEGQPKERLGTTGPAGKAKGQP